MGFLLLIGVLILGIGVGAWGQQAEPVVTLKYSDDYPTGEVLIGETFTFIVEFDIEPGSGAVGELPFVELYLDYGGADCNDDIPGSTEGPCDGLKFASASMKVSSPKPYPLQPVYLGSERILKDACGTGEECTTGLAISTNQHPYAPYVTALNLKGYQLVVLPLPFASYPEDAIPIEIVVTAEVHAYADHGTPLQIYARGGFRGQNPHTGQAVDLPFTPGVFTVAKRYRPHNDCSCPCTHCVDETPTGPNQAGTYEIIVDVADGQTIEDLRVADILSELVQFGPNGQLLGSPLPDTWDHSDPTSPGGVLEMHWDEVQGTLGPDIAVAFPFFVPEFSAGGDPIVWHECAPTAVVNEVEARAEWNPEDPRDVPGTVACAAAHELEAKCLTLRKSVGLLADANYVGTTPGDILEYRIEFRISDYTAFDGIVVEDFLSDGQTYRDDAMLHIEGPEIGVLDISLEPSFTDEEPDPIEYECPVTSACSGQGSAPIAVGTTMRFRVSDALGASSANTSVLAGDPVQGVPAFGVIAYTTEVADEFEDYTWFHQYTGLLPGETPEVDKLDALLNCARIRAVQVKPVPGVQASDGSFSCAQVIAGALQKTVYRVWRPTVTPKQLIWSEDDLPLGGIGVAQDSSAYRCDEDVFPGDEVTFRLYMIVPSCDAEDVRIEDWLPSPVFDVPSGWTEYTGGNATPPVGEWMAGPKHTVPIGPSVSTIAPNGVSFDFGHLTDNGSNAACVIDLLFTVEVSDAPLPDETVVVNIAQECERTTYGGSSCSGGSCGAGGQRYCQMAFAEFTLREPELHITKGVVAAIPESDPSASDYGTFDPEQTGPAGVAFGPPCVSPAFSGDITSNGLESHPIDSNLSDVDALDLIRFVLVVENRGGAPAFDVGIVDSITSQAFCFEEPDCMGGHNLEVTDGLSNDIYCEGTPPVACPDYDLLYGAGIELADPGPSGTCAGAIAPYNATSGENLVVLSYDVRLMDVVEVGQCCSNTAELLHYASLEGGADFVNAGLGGPFTDDAEACVVPTIVKCIVCTSEDHTTPQSTEAPDSSVPAVKGEIVRYRLVVTLPESEQYGDLKIRDFLDAKLRLIEDSVVYSFVYDGLIQADVPVNDPWPWGYCPGGCLVALGVDPSGHFQTLPPSHLTYNSSTGWATFDFGAVENQDSDADQEYLVIEFNAIVENDDDTDEAIPGQTGDSLYNYALAIIDGAVCPESTSDSVYVDVLGPLLELTKEVTFVDTDGDGCPSDDEVQIVVSVANTGSATAYDVTVYGETTCGAPSAHAWPVTATPFSSIEPGTGHSWTVPWTIDLDGNCCDCDVTITAQYSSLPGGFGTDPNCTGSAITASPGNLLGEWLSTSDSTVTCAWSFPLCGTIEGKKVDSDADGDGAWDPLPGWTITATEISGLYECSDVTDADGEYCLCVPPGEYTVSEELQPGYCVVSPLSPYTVTVEAGETNTGYDFQNLECCEKTEQFTVSWEDQDGVSQSGTVSIGCGGDATLPSPLVLGSALDITVDGDVDCRPQGPPIGCPTGCTATVYWSVYDDTSGQLLVSPQQGLPATFFLPDACPGSYRIEVESVCDGLACCTFTLHVPVKCGCEEWGSFHVSWPYTPPVALECHQAVPFDVVLGAGDEVTVESALGCSGDDVCCPVTHIWSVYEHTSAGLVGVQVQGQWLQNQTSMPASFPNPGAGFYRFVINGSCGDSLCGSCWIDMEIVNPECKCAGGTVTVSWPGKAPDLVPCDVSGQCTDVGPVVLDCTESVQFDLDGACCTGPATCEQLDPSVTWAAYVLPGSTWVAGGSGLPISFNPPGSGDYLVEIEVTCPNQDCTARLIPLTVVEDACNCSCAGWQLPLTVESGPVGPPVQSAVCGDVVVVPSGQTVTVSGGYDCVPPAGCGPKYAWQVVTMGSTATVASGICYSDPFAFDFVLPSDLVEVTLTPVCGFTDCTPCSFVVAPDSKSSCGPGTEFLVSTPYAQAVAACGSTVESLPIGQQDQLSIQPLVASDSADAVLWEEVQWRVIDSGRGDRVIKSGTGMPIEAIYVQRSLEWIVEMECPDSGGDTSSCDIRIEHPEVLCACERGMVVVSWGSETKRVPCDETIPLSIGRQESVEVSADWSCTGGGLCGEAEPRFYWVVMDLREDTEIAEGLGLPIVFDPPSSGEYGIGLMAQCPNVSCNACSACRTCSVTLEVREE